MKTKLQGPRLPYILDLETGISFPRDVAVSPDAIRRLAYTNWEHEGRPSDRGLANWLDAETELPPTSPLHVRAIPGVHLEPLPGENSPPISSEVTDGVPARRQAASDGPSPLCREAIGDDVRDYAFHLYVQSGCDEARKAECWEEANLCLDERIPKMAWVADRR